MPTTLEHKQRQDAALLQTLLSSYVICEQYIERLISGAMENALSMRVSVFTDQGGRKYMEDVTEIVVEPEPGEDDPTSCEPEENSGGDRAVDSPAVATHPHRTGKIAGPPQVSHAALEPVRAEDQDTPAGMPSREGQSPRRGQRRAAGRSRRSVAFFAVFDGHGGREAAQFARDYLWEFMKKQRGFWSECEREVCAAISKGFVACHHAMWKKLRKCTESWHSGCQHRAAIAHMYNFLCPSGVNIRPV